MHQAKFEYLYLMWQVQRNEYPVRSFFVQQQHVSIAGVLLQIRGLLNY